MPAVPAGHCGIHIPGGIVKALRLVLLSCALWAVAVAPVWAEGFGLTEWSSRGLSLAGGLVGRADDPSALAYNAAGITQLPGTQIMAGFAVIAPMGTISTEHEGGYSKDTTTKPNVWPAPHAYVTHQLNDRFWLGLGVFSRFGLGNEFAGNWVGRYNLTDVNFQTVSFVPTVAFKVNDVLSLAAGLDIMYASFGMGQQIPTLTLGGGFIPQKGDDNKLDIAGTGWGVGAHVAAHFRLSDTVSLGLAYKSQVALNINGEADFATHGSNLLAERNQVPHAVDCGASSTVIMPDSFALGLSYKPLDNLSFEVGTVWTRWSTFDSLDISFDSGYDAKSIKNWRDGWNFNASVEYEPLDWLALRAGIWYETPVTNETYAEFMVPSYGRTGASVGLGFTWGNWKLDLAYAHLWVNNVDYDQTRASGIDSSTGIMGGHSSSTSANIYSGSISYTF